MHALLENGRTSLGYGVILIVNVVVPVDGVLRLVLRPMMSVKVIVVLGNGRLLQVLRLLMVVPTIIVLEANGQMCRV